MSQRGFSFTEMMIVVTLGALLLLIGTAGMSTALTNARHDGAVRQVISDVRDARSRAITTGWEIRLVGFGAGATGDRANQYRVLGRQSSAVAWPSATGASFESATQLAGDWTDIGSTWPGVDLAATTVDQSFQVTFDSRGAAPSAAVEFNPVALVNQHGDTKSLTVTTIGAIRLE